MQERQITLSLSEGLFEAATRAAQQQGVGLEEMLRFAAYEYAERYVPELLISDEDTPAVVRAANALLSMSIDKGASEIYLIPQARNMSVIIQVEGKLSELMTIPNHLNGILYGRYVQKCSDPFGTRKPSFSIQYKDGSYLIFLTWGGDYESPMVLRLVRTGIASFPEPES